jgi:hypothetical protein
MSIDGFFDRRYRLRGYNCLHHTAEVWRHLTGDDIEARLAGVIEGVTRAHVAGFRRLAKAADPCLVLMRHAGTRTMHVGVMTAGRVIHIQERGVEYQPLDVAAFGFTDVRYYR